MLDLDRLEHILRLLVIKGSVGHAPHRVLEFAELHAHSGSTSGLMWPVWDWLAMATEPVHDVQFEPSASIYARGWFLDAKLLEEGPYVSTGWSLIMEAFKVVDIPLKF